MEAKSKKKVAVLEQKPLTGDRELSDIKETIRQINTTANALERLYKLRTASKKIYYELITKAIDKKVRIGLKAVASVKKTEKLNMKKSDKY